ncbi:MAG: uracil-DNA glycosylase family protein [Salinivirgaceae bacterium]|nr:uracil-DNA glycosylase family protein [Salinivirgaceae bacterium]
MMAEVELHPLKPFLPPSAKVLMLGSFPPPQARWSMDFFYPNFQNDMWRILGLVFFTDKNQFVIANERRFDYEAVVRFCTETGIAIFDTASAVRRLKDNASDKFLEIVESTDLSKLLSQTPDCHTIVTTGEKATDAIVNRYGCTKPQVGTFSPLSIGGHGYRFYRMPSSSRAYPLALEKKADAYRAMFKAIGMLP